MHYLITATIFLTACGNTIERNPVLLPETYSEISRRTAETASWATWCDGYPSAENCGDGDGLATTLGLLCSVSFRPACEAVSRSVKESGQINRSPKRDDKENTASRDQFLGFMIAQIAGENRWLDAKRFIKEHGVICFDATDTRCEITTNIWSLVGAVHKHLGYTRDATMIFNSVFFGKTMIAQSISVPTGYQLNLVVNSAYLAWKIGYEDDMTYIAALNAYLRQKENPWFCYVVYGADEKCAQLALKTWPNEPQRKVDWSIQRDTSEEAHTRSEGWEYIFMGSLFGVDPNSLEYSGKHHSKAYPRSH